MGLFLNSLQCRCRCRCRCKCRYISNFCDFLPFFWFKIKRCRSFNVQFSQMDKVLWYIFCRIVLDTVSCCIGNSWSLNFSFLWFCQLAVVVPCLSDIGASDLQHSSGSPIHFGLISAILLHDPTWVGTVLAHNCSWFPRCILPVLNPNRHTWSEFNVVFLQLFLLPSDEFLISFIHLLGS